MKRIAKCYLPILGLAWASLHFACQGPTLVTTPGPSSSDEVEGMLYYLPIGKIIIKGEYEKSEQSPTPTPTPTPTATATPTPTPTPTPTKQASTSGGKPKKGSKGTDSGGGLVTISGGQLKITVTSRVEADQEAGVYYVTPQTNDIFEDEVQVTVNSKHLLSAGKVTTEDKTAEIVGTIASIAAKAAGLREGATPTPTPTPVPLPFYFSFDPAKKKDVTFVQCQLWQRGIGLTVSASPKGKILDTPTVKAKAVELGKNGLVFRPAAAYNIQLIYPVDPTDGTPPPEGKPYIIKDTEQFILPDRTKLYVMKFDRMPFVKKVREVGFSDGMLTDFRQKRPSPILGFLGIPKAIVQAIVPIPGVPPSTGTGSASGTTEPH